jgi:hypothetical protein
MRGLRNRLTYSNVVATLALFLALGGGALAAIKLKRNSVGARHIKPNAVKSSELAPNSVKTGEIGSNAAGGADVLESSLGIVPNADRLDGLSATDITRRLDFSATNVVTINQVLGTVGGVELAILCEDDASGNTEVSIIGDTNSAATAEWERLSTSGNGPVVAFDEDFGTLSPADLLYFSSSSMSLNGSMWITLRGATQTVAIQASYRSSNSGSGTGSCEFHGVASIAQ